MAALEVEKWLAEQAADSHAPESVLAAE
jgi:hypothetical protein